MRRREKEAGEEETAWTYSAGQGTAESYLSEFDVLMGMSEPGARLAG